MNHAFNLDAVSSGLPAAQLIDPLLQAPSHAPLRVVVVAPPGTGKTTVVPPALTNRLQNLARDGKVVVTQPRRMAARAAARRLAQLSNTTLGQQVGYTVRGDKKVSPDTKVEFVTTGVLLRRLIGDPEAHGVSAIVLDEVHERHLDTDLSFAMVQQLGELRDTDNPLDVVVMSATLEAQFWADLLQQDNATPQVLSVEAVTHPLREQWAPLHGTQRALDARGVTNNFLNHIADTVIKTTQHQSDGDLLVFLPGAREIRRVAQRLRKQFSHHDGVEILELLGSTPANEQDYILRPEPARQRRRIVLATNVAESALTVPGVRIVVDAGLGRQSRLDTVRGVAGLVTVGAAKAAMIQRAGRAAREAPGLVVRCLSDAEFAARPAHTPPEMRTADLTQAVLDLACWGAADAAGLHLPEPLPSRAYNAAVDTLIQLGALHHTDSNTAPKITAFGRELAKLPVDPRLGRALYDGAEFVGGHLAAEVVATLASEHRAEGADVGKLVRRLRSEKPKRWSDDVARLLRALPEDTRTDEQHSVIDRVDLGMVTALAYPEQIGRLRQHANGSEYLLASGTAASLPQGSGLQGAAWLAIAEVTLHGDRAIIRSAAELDQDHAELAAGPLRTDQNEAWFHNGKISARHVSRLGAIELSATPIQPTPELTRAAVVTEIQRLGVLAFFNVDPEAKAHKAFSTLRARMGLLHEALGSEWPDVSNETLTDQAEVWLAPEIEQIASGTRLDRINLVSALHRLLPWPQAARFDQLAPERITVPSSSSIQLDWPPPEAHTDQETVSPVLAVKLQECFGWTASPTVADGRVPVVLHLLSPARRPLAVTADLASFWRNAYPEVRAQNRGRYVKHPWPEDPFSAIATAKTTRALRNEQQRSSS